MKDIRMVTVRRIFPEIINIVHSQSPQPSLSFWMAKLALQQIRTSLTGIPLCTRFAPSVTGQLHLGHAVNAVYTWGIAQALGGEVVIRLEDHDRGRFRPAFERGILADLEW